MNYLTTKDAAARWGVSERTVQKYCVAGRIAGAKKHANNWLLPTDCQKPRDPRARVQSPPEGSPPYVLYTAIPWQKSNPDAAVNAYAEPYRALTAASLAAYRGDYAPAKACWQRISHSDPAMLTTALIAGAAAISSGDYALYHDIYGVLNTCIQSEKDERTKALLSLPLVLVTVNMALPAMTPDWLQRGDFSLFEQELRPFLVYLYALHLRNTGDHRGVLALTRTALALMEQEHTFTWYEIYLRLLYAGTSYLSGDLEQARRSLSDALTLGAPHGLIAPYAEYLTGFGGMLEALLSQQYPHLLKPVTTLWKTAVPNWHTFRNQFTSERITTLLLPQEHHAALLFARGMTYRQAAQMLNISPSRVKGLLSSVYAKLGVSGRDELKKHLLTY